MSLYKVDVPPLVDGGAAGSAGPSMDGGVIKWVGTGATLIPVPSAEELLLLNRLQPEVQRRNNWLQDRVVALQAENERLREENERLREALKALLSLPIDSCPYDAATARTCARAALRREETNVHG